MHILSKDELPVEHVTGVIVCMDRVQWSRLRERKLGKWFAKLLATLIRMSLTGQVCACTLEACRIYIDSDSAWWHVGLHVKKWCILNCQNTVTGYKYWSVCRPVTVYWCVQWPLCRLETSGDGTHEVQFVKETDRGERKHPHPQLLPPVCQRVCHLLTSEGRHSELGEFGCFIFSNDKT